MSEDSVSQIATPKDPPTSIFSPINSQPDIFEKFRHSNSSQFSAFRLVKSATSENNQDSQSLGSEDSWIGRRTKRGCYRKYTVEEKEQAVKKIMSGHDVKEISKQYQIPRRNLLRWKKNGCQRKQGGGRPTDGQLQKQLYKKILSKDLKSQRQIRQQAKKLSRSENFKASKGWFSKFNKRFTNFNRKNSTVKLQHPDNQSGQYQNL